MVGHTSLSGVQRKVSLRLEQAPRTLRVAVQGAQYICKPQAQTFPALPENEHVTMKLAALAGIEVPPCGLVRLRDNSLAYIVKRFDRTPDGGKLLQEDFCQLAGKSPKEKYEGSYERCGKLTRRFASEPIIEAARCFLLVVFSFFTGNGDMHLKNFSLLRDTDGRYRLAPAYDLLCTRLVIEDDLLAMSVDGNKKMPTKRQWLALAQASGVPEKAALRVLRSVGAGVASAQRLIQRSYLPPDMRDAYVHLVAERGTHLSQLASS
jgi:serine/threonine-protein kinase HipA